MRKTMKGLTQGATRLLVLALGLGLVSTGLADFQKTNPVTGETENYTWKFVGTDVWNGTSYWQDSSGGNPSGVPAKSGDNKWEPILFDGNTINIAASMSVEGWNLRLGLYNGANVRLNTFVKWQGDTTMWVTVDDTSKFTVGGFGKGNLADGQVIKCSTTRENGIEWLVNLESTGNANNTFEYYLKGAGSVSYQAVSAANHKIKMADVTLSGTSQVASKTLVTFTSSSKTFGADATIKRLNSSGTDLNVDAHVAAVNTTGTTTLTTSGAVGTCELVQTTTGIVLYWVDGDPATLTPPVYKPSISINFTSGTAISTVADVGVGEYAIPGTSWNNLIGNNGSLNTVKGVDSNGDASTISGAKVTISGTRGYWTKGGLDAASDLRQAYIDDDSSNDTPTIVLEGIPYDKYKLVLYFSNDTDGRQFGHLTVNGTNYKWDSSSSAIVTCSGVEADCWGSSSSTAYTEGGNYLVFPAFSNGDGTLTVVGHRWSGTQRMGVAAMQIVEYVPEVGANDLEIAVDDDTAHTVTAAEAEKTGTVYLTGSGTLTLSGDYKITAATIDVGKDVVFNINSDRLDATTFTGSGTVVYNGSQPPTTKGFDDSFAWTGTVWVKNLGDTSRGEATNSKVNTRLGSDTADASQNELNKWGNARSFVKFTNVRAFMAAANVPWTLILEDDSSNYAWYNNDGWTARTITIAGLKGDGTFWDINDSGCRPFLNFTDASQFAGSIKALGKQVFLNGAGSGSAPSLSGGRIVVPSEQTFTVAAGKTWHTRNGLVVNGTLYVNGSLGSESSSAAISGSGTVVFEGKTPSPTGDAWWKNAAWTGTVKISNHTLPDNWLLGNYGNSGSKVCLDGVLGPIKHGDANHNVGELIIAANGYTHTGTYSSGTVSFTVPCKITGNGTYKMNSSGAASKTTYLTGDMSEFTGKLVFGDEHSRFIIGSTERAFVASSIVIGSGSSFTVGSDWSYAGLAGGIFVDAGGTFAVNSSGYVDSAGGLTIDGTVIASSKRIIWGGLGPDMTILINDTGVLEFTSTANVNDANYGNGHTDLDLSKVTGTGTLKYSSTAGWRAFPTADDHMPASTLTIQTELYDSLIISKNNGETVIGNLAGSKNIRSDFGDNGANGRILTVTQSKDTEWQGKLVSNRLTQFNVVAPAEGTPGTLTLSGTQDATVPMQIDGSVNLTGTWVGNTTVAGTFGGTGTLTGDLTFSAGSTFKAFASDENGLSVSGTVACPASGTVTVDVDALNSPASDVVLISNSGLDETNFALKSGTPANYTLKVEGNALKLKVLVSITVPAVENTTVTVTVGGDTIGTAAGSYYVLPGSEVTVTYAAVSGYELSGTATYTIASATDGATITITDTVAAPYVAQISGGSSYTTLQAAIDAVTQNKDIVLLANAGGATVSREITFNVVPSEYTYGDIVAEGAYILTVTTPTESKTRYSFAPASIAVTINDVRTLYSALTASTGVETANAGPIGTTIEILSGDPAYYAAYLPMFDLENGVFVKVANPVAAVYQGVVQQQVYRTLAEAIEEATAGQTVKLLVNVALDATVSVSKTLTFDLNGYAITASGINAITTSGALSVQGSSGSISATSGGSVVLTDAAATLTVSGVTLSPTPTTTVESSRVKAVTSAGATTYSVESTVVPPVTPSDVSPETAGTTNITAIVSVPNSDTTLTAATLIKTAGRRDHPILKVYDGTSGFYQWTWTNDTWEANALIKTGWNGTSPAANTVTLSAGQGVWVTYDPYYPLSLNGKIAEAGTTSVTVKKGYNLVAPPPTGEATYSIAVSVKHVNDTDVIMIPPKSENMPFVKVEWKEGGWKVWRRVGGVSQWAAPDAVPSGTGFWYINNGSSSGAVDM